MVPHWNVDSLPLQAPLFWEALPSELGISGPAAIFGLGFHSQCAAFSGSCGHFWMSEPDSSSDTTHEAILHNLVNHQRNLHRQVSRLEEQLQTIQIQLNTIQSILHQVFGKRGQSVDTTSKADRGDAPQQQ